MDARGARTTARPVWARLLVLVGVACVLGAGAGVGLAVLTREPDSVAGVAPTPAASTSTSAGAPAPPPAPGGVTVRVLGAVLHPASTASGRRRNRARLSVRVRVSNRSERVFVPERPVLLVPGHRVHTDPSADAPRTHIAQLAAGASAAVTLRFEVAGEVTTTVLNERRAHLVVAGRTRMTGVTLGAPITAPAAAAPETG